MTSASKVGDLFSAAGEAFAKLAELTRILQQTSAKNGSHSSSIENKEDDDENATGESGWLASDTESLQMAVKRFGDELNVISEHIKDKTMYQIKTTFRKIQPTLTNANASSEKTNSAEPSSTSTATTSAFGGHDSAAAYPAAGSLAASSSSSSSAAASSAAETTSSNQHAGSSGAAVGSNSFPATSSASAANAGAAAGASCSSPSPFLHYPLLRKSADITLNMLNARDDSDDDERVSMSVFNSV